MSPPSEVGEAALALHRAAYVLDAIRDRLTAPGAGSVESMLRSGPYVDLERLGQEAEGLTERLAAELGPDHDAVVAFAGSRAAVGEAVGTLGLLMQPGGPPKVAEETLKEFEGQRAAFDDCREQFLAAAARLPRKE